MRLFLILMARPSAVGAQAILATVDPTRFGAVSRRLQRLIGPPVILKAPECSTGAGTYK